MKVHAAGVNKRLLCMVNAFRQQRSMMNMTMMGPQHNKSASQYYKIDHAHALKRQMMSGHDNPNNAKQNCLLSYCNSLHVSNHANVVLKLMY
ncbi:MAG: hypothetical protein HNEKOMLI_00430 [Sodalis sp. Psp]|nr:hypothetical protein [Sodalis sp. Psp]MCR3756907.1 hypothetical protein [Sodalis sp. Ppy]